MAHRTGGKISPIIALLALAVASVSGGSPAQAADCRANKGPGVDWQGCRKRNLVLTDSDLSGANLEETDFTASDLRNTKLKASNLTKATMVRSYLDGSDAEGADFDTVMGYRTSFVGVNLHNATFVKAELTRADFTDANLVNVDFEKADLGRAKFVNADLTGSRFPFANLSRADFRKSRFEGSIDLTGAYLFLTRIEGIDLSNAVGLADWQVEMTCGNDETKLPSQFSAPKSWPCHPDS